MMVSATTLRRLPDGRGTDESPMIESLYKPGEGNEMSVTARGRNLIVP